jgi:hypothetical protein
MNHDCKEDGHNWEFRGYDDGRPCYRCRFCGKESC